MQNGWGGTTPIRSRKRLEQPIHLTPLDIQYGLNTEFVARQREMNRKVVESHAIEREKARIAKTIATQSKRPVLTIVLVRSNTSARLKPPKDLVKVPELCWRRAEQ